MTVAGFCAGALCLPLLSRRVETGGRGFMADRMKLWLVAAMFLAMTGAGHAATPPADPCSLLQAADVSKTLGGSYGAPSKTVAPRPYANTAEGTDCHYQGGGSDL